MPTTLVVVAQGDSCHDSDLSCSDFTKRLTRRARRSNCAGATSLCRNDFRSRSCTTDAYVENLQRWMESGMSRIELYTKSCNSILEIPDSVSDPTASTRWSSTTMAHQNQINRRPFSIYILGTQIQLHIRCTSSKGQHQWTNRLWGLCFVNTRAGMHDSSRKHFAYCGQRRHRNAAAGGTDHSGKWYDEWLVAGRS